MKFNYFGISKEEKERLQILEQLIDISNGKEYNLYFKNSCNMVVTKRDNNIELNYDKPSQLGRSFLNASLLISREGDGIIEETEHFEDKGIMLDLSRAGAMKVEKIKEFINYMSLLGFNALMLYMEDVFKMEPFPYFGYMRGAYSKEELKEINAYGIKMGLEIIPCIQTLGHFEQYLKWREASEITDTKNVILAGFDKTYEFIDEILKVIKECFTTKKIHIGQDEAWGLGSGNYLKKFGYKHQMDIFVNHINKTNELIKKYDFEPMIWSDMYFRISSPNGGYYDENTVVSEDVKKYLPENMKITYWDYYHKDKQIYKNMIAKHKKITDRIVFAGGIWLWSGFLPDYITTFETANTSINVCKDEGIKDIYATAWGDDGCDTNGFWALPGLCLFAEHFYNKDFDEAKLDEKLQLLFSATSKDFIELSNALYPIEGEPTSIKQILYSEILLGMSDCDMNKEGLSKKYYALKEQYLEVSKKSHKYKKHFEYAATLCEAAGLKVEISKKLFGGYKQNEALLLEVKEKLLPCLNQIFKKIQCENFDMWHDCYKAFGFEVTNARIGGKIASVEMAIKRLENYLDGSITSIEELEEKRLPFSNQRKDSSFYGAIASSYVTTL